MTCRDETFLFAYGFAPYCRAGVDGAGGRNGLGSPDLAGPEDNADHAESGFRYHVCVPAGCALGGVAGRGGISFSCDRFLLCSIVTVNRSAFRGLESFNSDIATGEQIETRTGGVFYDVTARVQLNIRF